MPGLINPDDIATVRERARIDEIVGSYVTLRRAGGDAMKGLCPFHSEKTPSFQVTPSRGFFYCFGCGEGGDVISFVQKIDNLSFTEAVEKLAAQVGIQLRYEDDGKGARTEPGLRSRILAANAAAAEFYAAALAAPEALPGRQLLDGRGFDRQAAEHFGVGWAPRSGRALGNHLRKQGFRDDELIKAGLIRAGGGYDFFQGRVLWPIRDSAAGVLGFGARRVFDDDRMPAKYLNTPETPIYKKSHVLYGLDLARQNIGKKSQAVVVEGYTDVMACHLAGVDTAVASCGTAFGEEHARLVQRLMGGRQNGEVVFTFDGDAAGQAAALKVFQFDAEFTAQTYVAVEASGMDPCDLRMARGDAAVRELVASRTPLYRFVLGNILQRYDLDRADARVDALREAAPLVWSVRDQGKVAAFSRDLAGMLGMPEDEVVAEVRRARGKRPTVAVAAPVPEAEDPNAAQPSLEAFPEPDPNDRSLAVERDTAKLLVQAPLQFTQDWNGISEADFRHPGYAAVFRAVLAAGEPEDVGEEQWAQAVRAAADSDAAQRLIVQVGVEPLLREPDYAYVDEYAARLQLLALDARVADLKSKLQRTNPVQHPTRYDEMFKQLVALETQRKAAVARSFGG